MVPSWSLLLWAWVLWVRGFASYKKSEKNTSTTDSKKTIFGNPPPKPNPSRKPPNIHLHEYPNVIQTSKNVKKTSKWNSNGTPRLWFQPENQDSTYFVDSWPMGTTAESWFYATRGVNSSWSPGAPILFAEVGFFFVGFCGWVLAKVKEAGRKNLGVYQIFRYMYI